jgi:hypothetical protein
MYESWYYAIFELFTIGYAYNSETKFDNMKRYKDLNQHNLVKDFKPVLKI